MTPSGAPITFAVDAGGTSTRMTVLRGGTAPLDVDLPSVNPSSVGDSTADDGVRDVFAVLRHAAGGDAVEGVFASAAIGGGTLAYWQRAVAAAMHSSGLRGAVHVMNDVDPLLFGAPLRGVGGVLVVGTGSCVLARDGAELLRLGGTEYLASDEGSAFQLGRAGLVAAVRAYDGRGARTAIRDRLERDAGVPVDGLARRLAELPHPKTAVARLATAVTAAWLEDGDDVARGIVEGAVADLADMVRHVSRRLGPLDWVMTGGVVCRCAPFTALLRSVVADRLGQEVTMTLTPDCRRQALSMVAADGSTASHDTPTGAVVVTR
ncbi:hypothetical protein Drose_33050 [Dactylosporangium roseum]|uniref:ATPase BadF/BadG/BcrA/BcrD type domain-containing protein n=1 Tax=Dactylosporangium roseum TaxID=47989 RepID=A0ABY5Z549_9ACTN|nr:BadF/BadG/BcrA/BcrD ATPase family protein [Dactylosporangium roseum]UWZ35868.1 hypothetical protein Drose_33050 [Dactylosporangium roseum]